TADRYAGIPGSRAGTGGSGGPNRGSAGHGARGGERRPSTARSADRAAAPPAATPVRSRRRPGQILVAEPVGLIDRGEHAGGNTGRVRDLRVFGAVGPFAVGQRPW